MTTVMQTENERKNRYLIFRISDDLYGLEVQNLKEVYQTGNILKLPRTSAVLEGIVNLRGYIVSIFNLSILLWGTNNRPKSEISTKNESKRNTILLMTIKDHDVGVLVDQIYSLDTITEFISKDETYFDGKKLQNSSLISQIGFLDGKQAVFILELENLLGGFVTSTKAVKDEKEDIKDSVYDFDQYTLPDPEESSQELSLEGKADNFDLNNLNLPEDDQLIDKFDQEILEDRDVKGKNSEKKKKSTTKRRNETKKTKKGKKDEKTEKANENKIDLKKTKRIEEKKKVKKTEKAKKDDI